MVPTHPKNMLRLRKGSSYEYIQTVVLDGQYCLNCIFHHYKRMGFLLRFEGLRVDGPTITDPLNRCGGWGSRRGNRWVLQLCRGSVGGYPLPWVLGQPHRSVEVQVSWFEAVYLHVLRLAADVHHKIFVPGLAELLYKADNACNTP